MTDRNSTMTVLGTNGNGLDRITAFITHTNAAGAVLTRRTFSHDVASRLTDRTQHHPGDAANRLDSFGHNLRSELTAAALGTDSYAYIFDGIGNREQSAENAAALNPLRFSSEVWDGTLGLVYYNWRHLNVLDGRLTNRDPIGERGGLNLYGFVGNTPVSSWDVRGLISSQWAFAGDPNDRPAYERKYIAVYGPTGKFSVKWEYSETECGTGKTDEGHYGPRIYQGLAGGYYPLISSHYRDPASGAEDSVKDGFGAKLLQGILGYCVRGNITITIRDSGKETEAESSPPRIKPGITTNFHQHTDYANKAGELSGKALVITVTFDFCDGKDVYEVTSNPGIDVKQKRYEGRRR